MKPVQILIIIKTMLQNKLIKWMKNYKNLNKKILMIQKK